MATQAGVRRLTAVDAGAAALGLFAGQKATDAAALAPELVTAEAQPALDEAALTALADWCARFSPAVAIDAPDGLFLDITGVAHLWGGEAAMVSDLIARLGANGLPARAAVAATPAAAWALAHFGEDRTLAAPGEEETLLSPLPITALRLAPEATAQIARLGLTTLGRLAGQPRASITRRFGREVVQRLDQAFGRAAEALTFRRPPSPWFARLAFVEPISVPEDLARVTGNIAALLCARLEAQGRGARRFELAFHRLDGVIQRLAIGLALPGRDGARATRLFAPLLDQVDPGFGIEVVTLVAQEVEAVSSRQRRLDEAPEAAVEDGIGPLVDRLANRLGPGAVWRVDAFPSHIPERAVARRPALSPFSGARWDPAPPCRPRGGSRARRPGVVAQTLGHRRSGPGAGLLSRRRHRRRPLLALPRRLA